MKKSLPKAKAKLLLKNSMLYEFKMADFRKVAYHKLALSQGCYFLMRGGEFFKRVGQWANYAALFGGCFTVGNTLT